ncbi:MAG: (d)CMP kinase [Chloroflexi bacterium]|nr:(d)CMP kinase [Chloroflexota bacterium]
MSLVSKKTPKRIALDGTPASGKSTVGAMLADRWNCDFLDTGMMYRAVTYLALQNSFRLDDNHALGNLASDTQFSIRQDGNGSWRLLTNGVDVTDELHKSEINRYVSPVSAVPEVRRSLVNQQREIAAEGPIVMAGQDIGTVVLKDAPMKIYLDASAETRAARRTRDAHGNVDGQRFDEVLRSLSRRGEIDSNRADSPLRPADDAFIIQTDALTLEEVVERIIELAPDDVKEHAPK